MSTQCTVCESEIPQGNETYSNLWEASLKKHPCCSKDCAAKFNVDVHWIPPDRPAPLQVQHVERTTEAALSQLHRGQAPESVARSLLLAGVAPVGVRGVMRRVIADLDSPPIDAAMRHARSLTVWTAVMSIFTWLFSGWILIASMRGGRPTESKADRKRVLEAELIIDAWERHFRLALTR